MEKNLPVYVVQVNIPIPIAPLMTQKNTNPNIIAKIVSTHFGPSYGKEIEEQLIREAAEEDFEDSMYFYDRDQDVLSP
ncbi:hypothetical protein BpHYR1_014655 [Brachionus plicatilis]|uniref:Uncharacterized protein n=1 Tax=Brachionus plicatilis TaxID=10195 RepID=A0A3M7R1L8_BRAPC|nr:hypothetical protein BpHYR1_014655 [Brachionus plicatilis]